MEQVTHLVEGNQNLILVALASFTLLIFFILIFQGLSFSKWKKRYLRMMGGKDIHSLEEMLTRHNAQVGEILEHVEDILERQRTIDKRMEHCVQKVGMVRYNAFNDMGSDLSYSIALLNERDDGVVMSGIFGRDFCNTYAKPIQGGVSHYKLTAEEILALDRAKRDHV